MKKILFLIAFIVIYFSLIAQSGEGYNPSNPGDPNPFYKLQLEVSPEESGTISNNSTYLSAGQRYYCSVSSNLGYKFKHWMMGDSVVSENKSFYFTMPSENVILIAYFDWDDNYSPNNPGDPFIDGYVHNVNIYSSPSSGGYFSMNNFKMNEGATAKVYAYPYNYFKFVSWEHNGVVVSTSNPLDITMGTTDLAYVANFEYDPESPGELEEFTNILRIPDVTAAPLKQATIPVYVDNANEVTGLQFTIDVPSGMNVETGYATVSSRGEDHLVSVEYAGTDKYTCTLYSPTNKSLRGYTGKLFDINFTLSDSFNVGSIYDLVLSNMAITDIYGNNVMTSYNVGRLEVIDGTDLAVTNVEIQEQQLIPGESVTIAWNILNDGAMPTTSGWKEEVSLVNENGESLFLGTVYYNNTLSANEQLFRSATFNLSQIMGIDGEVKAKVKVISNTNSGEEQSLLLNNVKLSDASVNVVKKLFIELPKAGIVENNTLPVRCKLLRSGNWTMEESFTLSKSDDDRIILPSTITIPKGQSAQYFNIEMVDNNIFDNDSKVIVSVIGNDYEETTAQMDIIDNDYPSLIITPSYTEINEGDIFQLYITTENISNKDVTLYISCDHSKYFNYPSQVVLPAGEETVMIDLTAIENEQPNMTLDVKFTVRASFYSGGECNVELFDNDLPEIELELTPTTVSESAGPIAMFATLRRLSHLENKVTIELYDDSDNRLYYPHKSIVMTPGVEEAQFAIGTIDNDLVDGDQEINVTAAIYISSCNCSVSGTNAGVVSRKINIMDDDGPALKITSSKSMLLEGNEEATVLTITRNTDSATPLNVMLSSDADDMLFYDKIVNIPAGETSANVVVSVRSNDTSSDNRTVIFTAEADEHSNGICWVMITDQTLPDAVVAAVIPSSDQIIVGDTIDVSVVIVNEGVAPLTAPVRTTLYMNNGNELATYYTQDDIASGDTVIITKKVALPASVGNYSMRAIINESQTTKELIYVNNTSDIVSFSMLSPFTATLYTDKQAYNQGETVFINGKISGKNTANAEVEIYFIDDGMRHYITVTTDAEGRFSTSWQPYIGLMGHFSIGACYPNENLRDEYVSIDIYGLKRTSNAAIICETLVGESYNGEINLYNPSMLPLTGVAVEVISSPENCNVITQIPYQIDGNKNVLLTYTITNDAPSMNDDWEENILRVTTDEGVSIDIKLYYYCYSPEGEIKASISKINTTMIKGTSREFSFTITNQGKGETGTISLALPNVPWMKSLTPVEMASLAYGESTNVVLHLIPTDDLQLNVPLTGYIGINCENGNGIPLSYRIEPVSEYNGTLIVDVRDEYTYYTDEAPHVSGAQVLVKHPVTGATIANGITGEDGKFSVELPEGFYKISVSADNHNSDSKTIAVDPGKENEVVVNLSFRAITIDWEVEEIEIEDEYSIVTTIQYETNVPMPVVELSIPQSIPAKDLADGESLIFNATLTNKGLITAQDAELLLPEGFTTLKFEPLVEYSGLKIAPQQSITIPVKVTRTLKRDENIDNDPCVGQPGTLYYWDCGNDRKWHRYGIALQLGTCQSDDPSTWDNSGNGNYGGGNNGYPTGGGGNYNGPTYHPNQGYNNFINPLDDVLNPITSDTDEGCEPCQNGLLLAGLKCAGHFADDVEDSMKDMIDLANEIIKHAQDIAENGVDVGGMLDAYVDNIIDEIIDTYTLNDEIEYVYELCDTISDAISTCATASHDFDGFYSCYSITSDVVDKMLDDAVMEYFGEYLSPENAKKLKSVCKKILKIKDWLDIAADCANDFVHACDHLNDDNSKSTNVDYTTSVLNNLELICEQLDALGYINDVMWGYEPEWNDVSYYEMSILMDSVDYVSQDFEDVVQYKPESLSLEKYRDFFERRKAYFVNGMPDSISAKMMERVEIMYNTQNYFEGLDYSSPSDYIKEHIVKLMEHLEGSQSSVCSSITLQFSQTMTMTRQAFRGTLTVFNGHESLPMENVKLTMDVRDEYGTMATPHEFQINVESLNKFDGELDLDAGWSLNANETGVATILFIPTKYAAPTEEMKYSFGGTLSYTDPFTGLEVSRDLYPVTLTVKPSPNLEMTYFMQRDILGDDPLTTDVEEPMVPAEFSVLINNVGYGDATNVRMVTEQPEIIDNEKGLLIDFELLSSQLNGGDHTMALGGSVATEFGTIGAHSTTYAQWWIQSSLLGHFTDYDINATHVTSYGNEDLSLLDTVTIHELIRSINISDENNLVGFLVNDVVDAEDMPDALYLSDGNIENVNESMVANIIQNNEVEYLLSVTPSKAGWNYGSLIDPTNGLQNIVSIVRQSDNKEINLRNFWQTNITLRDGADPLYENRIHFIDHFEANDETYLLTFEPIRSTILEVDEFIIPSGEKVLDEPLEEIVVRFNKAVNKQTFTTDDITLRCHGVLQDASKIGITQIDEKTFKLKLSALSENNGFYVLTVQTEEISDAAGFNGNKGKMVSWTQYSNKVNMTINVSPENAAVISHETGIYDYGETLSLSAISNDGYNFLSWNCNNEVISTMPTYDYFVDGDATIVAKFIPKNYTIDVVYDNNAGKIYGAGSGIYQYGDYLSIMAEPTDNYLFDGWYIADTLVSKSSTYTHMVYGSATIEAKFVKMQCQTLLLENDWNWISTYIELSGNDGLNRIQKALGGNAQQIKSQLSFSSYNDGNWYGLMESASTEEMYMIMMLEEAQMSLNGNLVDPAEHPITLQNNWTWFGYILNEDMSLEDGLANFTPNSGDYIKSQLGFNTYYNGSWYGETELSFEVGKGYMYRNTSGAAKTLVYPSNNSKGRYVGSTSVEKHWHVDVNKYPTNMSIIAVVNVDDEEMTDYEIGAFSDGECRGSARPVYVDALNRYLLFLTVHGEGNDEITFRYYDVVADEEYDYVANEMIYYSADATIGTMPEPYTINFGTTNVNDHTYCSFEVYPNPVDKNNEIHLGTICEKVEVYNSIGVKVAEYSDVNTIDGIEVPGVYIINAIGKNSVKYCRLIVK